MNTQTDLARKAKSAVEMTFAIADAIKDLGQVNAGEFYAHLCGKIDINDFEAILSVLRNAGVIQTKGHVIYWTGPKAEVIA